MDDIVNTEEIMDRLEISDDALLTIATLAAGRVKRAALLGSGGADGVRRIFGIRTGQGKGVRIETDGVGGVACDLTVNVEYGASIVEVAREIQEAVRGDITEMTGMRPTRVSVHVNGVVFRDRKAEAKESKAEAKAEKTVAKADAGKVASDKEGEAVAQEESSLGGSHGADQAEEAGQAGAGVEEAGQAGAGVDEAGQAGAAFADAQADGDAGQDAGYAAQNPVPNAEYGMRQDGAQTFGGDGQSGGWGR